jgi:oxepin-CoA hydrolase/3-oxo-5,6-dehydrosuberyl-CoA semialdehyde dehydrogenase
VTAVLESYAAGSWVRGDGDGVPLLDAATGEEVARLADRGPDPAGLVAHGRDVGGPALRAMTFHERATALKAVAKHLLAHKDELYELSYRTGATAKDSFVDVDGGIGTVFSFASKAYKELPDDTVHVDGNVEQLGRAGRFLGVHVMTSRPGVAVQVNAFNFPVWGFLEKLAPAFLAGLPSIVKPAPQTAYLTQLAVRRMLESGLLPEGSLQVLCAPPDGLLEALGPQDHVAFTGSAATGQRLREHPAVVHGGVRLGVEADSLNCSVLGPDVSADDPELDLFVKAVVAEMTVKAGQKCTAIRRVLVPEGMTGTVVEAISSRLDRVTVGHPAHEGVRMGPLVSLEQREALHEAIDRLLTSARVVHGAVGRVDVVGADAQRGAFVGPVLLQADGDAAEPHDVEPFGPVSTVIGYRDLDHAVELAARGSGSLVGSLVTHDPHVARDFVLGTAPWHGRILVLDHEAAPESTGHGSPLPMLVHGGPGRAGGGEELGGVRAVLHHLQRTAVQGSPDMLTAVTGRWTKGSQRREGDVHPFRRSLAELRVGDTVRTGSRTVTLDDVDHFAEFTGDTFYAHTDPEAAAQNPLFGGIVAHGYLVVSLAAGLFVDPAPGPVLANVGVDHLRFLTPVKPGDELSVLLTVKQITPRSNADHGEVRWDALVSNGSGEAVATYDVLTMVAKQWPPA